MTSSRQPLAVACAALLALSLAACGGSHHPKAASTSPTPTSSPSTPSTSAPAVAAPAINPLTGGKPSTNPVIAVKIDDTANGRPQVNIDQADIVYVEQVEGGLTRLLAVFNSSLPVVEAVRSTRANDPELLGDYGAIDYVASGGGGNPLMLMDRSPLKTTINDRGGPGFARDPNRPEPYNLQANLETVAHSLHGITAHSIGFVWSAKASLGHDPAAQSIATLVGGTPVDFAWNPHSQRYDRYIDGVRQFTAENNPIATPNVIVQYCRVTVYPQDVDVDGNPSMYTHSIGTGKVVVFRNGRRIDGTWSRASLASGTRLTDTSGKPIALAPGGAWVILVAIGAPLTS